MTAIYCQPTLQALSCSQTGGLRKPTGQSMNGFDKYTLIALTMDENSAEKVIFPYQHLTVCAPSVTSGSTVIHSCDPIDV